MTSNEEYCIDFMAGMFNELAEQNNKYCVHKSPRTYSGKEVPDGQFIVAAMYPTGLVSFLINAKHWDKFKVPIYNNARFAYDNPDERKLFDRIRYSWRV